MAVKPILNIIGADPLAGAEIIKEAHNENYKLLNDFIEEVQSEKAATDTGLQDQINNHLASATAHKGSSLVNDSLIGGTSITDALNATKQRLDTHVGGSTEKHKLSDQVNDSIVTGSNGATALNTLKQQVDTLVVTGTTNTTIGVYSLNVTGVNTYVGTVAGLTLFGGQKLNITFVNSNTGASTLNINSLGAKPIKITGVGGKRDPMEGELIAGATYQVQYDGTDYVIITSHLEKRVIDLENSSGYYGLRWNVTDDIRTRTGANTALTNFNNVYPWSNMRRCNLSDAGVVNAYYGDPTYIEDGSNGQVMVEIPKFYSRYRAWTEGGKEYIQWDISAVPYADFEVDPAFRKGAIGNYTDKIYMSAYEGSIFDVSASTTEINTLTVTAAATSSGNVTVTLDLIPFTVAVLNTDNTTDLVATKLRAASYTGWTTSGTGSAVIFTSTTTGARTTATFSGGTTGVTASIVKTQTGAGGYVINDTQVADFTVTTGDKLSSIANVKPCSGLTQNLTIGNSRILANNRGTGWGLWNGLQVYAVQKLLFIEYASFNSQTVIGQGVVNKASGAGNESEITGATSFLGNASGRQAGTDGLTSVSYRGIENMWGNIWSWVDGINIQADNKLWINPTNQTFTSDSFVAPYELQGTLWNVNGYISNILKKNVGLFATASSGSSSTRISDFYFQSIGNRVARLGSSWIDGAAAGFACWYLDNSSAARNRDVGARLSFQ